MPILNWFWSGFWPNVAATLIGVVVGVPIALYLNKFAGNAIHKRSKEESAVRLRNALSSLSSAITHNELKLSDMQKNLREARAVFDLGVDTAAW